MAYAEQVKQLKEEKAELIAALIYAIAANDYIDGSPTNVAYLKHANDVLEKYQA